MTNEITEIQLTGKDWEKVYEHVDAAHKNVLFEIAFMVDFSDPSIQGVDLYADEAAVVWEAMESLGMVPDGEGE